MIIFYFLNRSHAICLLHSVSLFYLLACYFDIEREFWILTIVYRFSIILGVSVVFPFPKTNRKKKDNETNEWVTNDGIPLRNAAQSPDLFSHAFEIWNHSTKLDFVDVVGVFFLLRFYWDVD